MLAVVMLWLRERAEAVLRAARAVLLVSEVVKVDRGAPQTACQGQRLYLGGTAHLQGIAMAERPTCSVGRIAGRGRMVMSGSSRTSIT